jgi:hypothetical protein
MPRIRANFSAGTSDSSISVSSARRKYKLREVDHLPTLDTSDFVQTLFAKAHGVEFPYSGPPIFFKLAT